MLPLKNTPADPSQTDPSQSSSQVSSLQTQASQTSSVASKASTGVTNLSLDGLSTAYTGTVSDRPDVARAAAKTTLALARLGLINPNAPIHTFKVDTKAGTITHTSTIKSSDSVPSNQDNANLLTATYNALHGVPPPKGLLESPTARNLLKDQ